MSNQLIINHVKHLTVKPYRIEKQYFNDDGVYAIDKYTWLEFNTLKEAKNALKKMQEETA